MKETDIEALAFNALNAVCLHIQNELGVKSGDTAGMFFSGTVGEQAEEMFKSYIHLELSMADPGETAYLLNHLRSMYPDKEFKMGSGTLDDVIFLNINDMAIHDPMESECGRFESEDHYGLSLEDAKAMSEHNKFYNPGE